jgi:serine beta-lactamase-like protein LACTB
MKRYLVLLVILHFSCYSLVGQRKYAGAVEKAHRLGSALVQESGIPGLSMAVLKEGKIIYTEGFGFADLELQIPVTTTTQFRTASVAKVITATALGNLLQNGLLKLDAEVQQYVPSFPLKKYPVTVRQLAGHLSGLSHYNSSDRLEKKYYSSVNDALSVFSHQPLMSEPGTVYNYSTHAFTLLSAVIEHVSGKPYLNYMADAVFAPLGMTMTGPDLRANTPPTMSSLYSMKNGKAEKELLPEDPSYKWAGGGLISTPTDLVKLADGYMNGFLSKSIVDTLFKSQYFSSGKASLVGIGWRISQDIDGRTVRDHAGSMGGARSVVVIYPDQKMAIALMVNAEWAGMIEETAQMIMLPFLKTSNRSGLLKGEFPLAVTFTNGKNETSVHQGRIVLEGNRGLFETSGGLQELRKMSLIHIDANRYAWVRPDGICYLEINIEKKTGKDRKKISGKAIAYGSRLDHNPLTNPAFLSFISKTNEAAGAR